MRHLDMVNGDVVDGRHECDHCGEPVPAVYVKHKRSTYCDLVCYHEAVNGADD